MIGNKINKKAFLYSFFFIKKKRKPKEKAYIKIAYFIPQKMLIESKKPDNNTLK